MTEIITSNLPFLTRDMLNFEHAVRFSLRLTVDTYGTGPLTIRGMTKDGVFTLVANITAEGLSQVFTFNLVDLPIMVCVADEGGNYGDGMTYCSLDLLINNDKAYQLASGYVWSLQNVSWPVSNQNPIIDHGSAWTIASGSDPAANVEASYTIPTGRDIEVHSVRVRLVTDANAANRRVHLTFSYFGTIFYETFNDIDQTASLTRDYIFANHGDVPDREDGTTILVPMAGGIVLRGGAIISTATQNRQATDNFTALSVYGKVYIE